MKNDKTKIIFFGLVSTLLSLILIEIFFTFFLLIFSQEYHPIIKYYSSKNLQEKINNIEIKDIKKDKYTRKMIPGNYIINNYEVKINSKGFRGNDFLTENVTGCRIIAFGGSTTLGLQSKKSYPLILEEKLNRNNYECEVLNFGFSGKSLNFIEDLIINEAIDYSPNIISIMSNTNSSRYDSFKNSSISSGIIETKFQLYLYKTNKFFYNYVMTYKFMKLVIHHIAGWSINKKEKIPSPIANDYHLKKYYTEKYLNQLINIANFLKSKNIKLILIKQAWFIDLDFQKKISNLSKNKVIEMLMNYKKSDYRNKNDLFWMLTMEILNKNLEEIKILNPEIILVDPLKKLYKDEKEVNFFKNDGLHLNDNGNKIIAEEIFKKIKPDL